MTLHGIISALIVPLCFYLYWWLYATIGPGLILTGSKLYLYIVGLLAVGTSFIGLSNRLADRSRGGMFLQAMELALLQTLIIALALFGIAFLAQEQVLSRLFIVTFLLVIGFVLNLLNYYLPQLLGRLILDRSDRLSTMLIGSSMAAQKLWGWLKNQEQIGMKVVGLVTDENDDKGLLGVNHLGKAWEIDEILARNPVDQVILLESMISPERLRVVFRHCQRAGVRILIYSYWEDLLNYPLKAVSEGEATFFTLGAEPLENPINRFWKRTLDIVVSLPVCLIILPLLMLVVRIKHLKESPGPLFFKQERTGRRKKTFELLKFRTMHAREGDSTDTRQAQKGDERIFKFGQRLRRTSLDEIPQFWNVLRGHMSIVGPRPHMLAHDKLFADYIDIYRSRHFVKPGITGLAQVNGFRGEITEIGLLEQRIRFDIDYITHWSLRMDIVIILKTALQVIFPKSSAY